MSLRIIATGGTFDKHYDAATGDLIFTDSILPSAIGHARFAQSPVLESLFALDSLDMQDTHREQILAACQRSPEKHIVIVHGTDTLCETAQVLARAQLPCTIVLMGAMVPYRFENSDALFNLGFACSVAQISAPGVYIAMNAQIFTADNVRKNRELARFERLN
jgi:L-asparaginase